MTDARPAIIGGVIAVLGFLGSDAISQRDQSTAEMQDRLAAQFDDIKGDLHELVGRVRQIEITVTTIKAKGGL